MKNICIIGSGHVGLVTGACLAELGNRVICTDINQAVIEGLKRGIMPFFEPGLEDLVVRNAAAGRLEFSTDVEQGVSLSGIVFITVNYSFGPDVRQNPLASLEKVLQQIGRSIGRGRERAREGAPYTLIVEKSTLPVNTCLQIRQYLSQHNLSHAAFDVVCNPEFLREGSAVSDFMHPDRIVIGADNSRAAGILKELYEPLKAPLLTTGPATAELIKHASNVFLALKVSYINAIACLCERTGADVKQVAAGMGWDKRIGPDFLNAGLGYGGYCLPKDVAALVNIAEAHGYDFELLKAVQQINNMQRVRLVEKVKNAIPDLQNKTIGVLGLSFKPATDDMREAPSVEIIRRLQTEGARIKAYDPQAMENAGRILQNIEYGRDAYSVAEGSDALVILTEWDEFKHLDLARIKRLLKCPIIIDGRNIWYPVAVRELGFVYAGVGIGNSDLDSETHLRSE